MRPSGIIFGLLFLANGILGLLAVNRIIFKNPTNPEKLEDWHHKFDKTIRIVSPISIICGIILFILAFTQQKI